MKAIQYAKFGNYKEVLKPVEIKKPELQKPTDVLVKVTTISLNPMDWGIMSVPQMAELFGVSLPMTFCYDFAGVVESVGEAVTAYQPGDRVFGTSYEGTAQEYILMPETRDPHHRMLHTPDGISDEVAATIGVCGSTAIDALNKAQVKAGDKVVISAAGGGVGVYAVQLAKAMGATVYGTCSPSSFDFVNSLGAKPIAYGEGLKERLAPLGITAALDLFDNETAKVALELGVTGDKVSSIIPRPTPPAGVQGATGSYATDEDLQFVLETLVSGQMIVPIAGKFDREDYLEALDLQAGRHAHGKVIITL
ncbi:MAG: NADP-dependent oxidoreductase [Streptococcaceae bacterium]|jgi:NADPH:quinone reductase-like Zn-dependent oxidoreductase|nr:NADP-dependent oxidoreductase [Streptococcaceae bacterium]